MDGKENNLKTADTETVAGAAKAAAESPCTNEETKEKIHHFDPEFDASLVEILIQALQRGGCFFCDKRGASSKCSRCKIAVYCDKECQRKGWYENGHKYNCKCFCGELKEQETMIFALRSAGWLAEEQFMMVTNKRRDLLLSMISSLPEKPSVSFTSSVIEILGSLRLVGTIAFYDAHKDEMREIRDVFIHPVAEATPEARHRLYDGSGTITKEARARVIEEWLEFAKDLKQYELSMLGITFGRGMLDFARNEEFRRLLGEAGFKDPLFAISEDYCLMNEFYAGLKTLM